MLVKAKTEAIEGLLSGLQIRVNEGDIRDLRGAIAFVEAYAEGLSDLLSSIEGSKPKEVTT